jgi:hypothetical protein
MKSFQTLLNTSVRLKYFATPTADYSNILKTVRDSMAKSVSKSEAVKLLNSKDALEVLLETVDRNETISSKQSKVNRFISDFQKQIKDERDVVLVAVKVK